MQRARLRAGATVILDAAFLGEEQRQGVLTLGREAGVPVTALWLKAPTEVLGDRLERRQSDASDADAGVMLRQAEDEAGPPWVAVDAGRSPKVVLAEVRALIAAMAADKDADVAAH